MNRVCVLVVGLLTLLLADGTQGQPVTAPEVASLRGDSAQTRKRLAEADQKVQTGKAADAIDDIQRVLDDAADDLVSLDGKQFRSARWIAHQILAKLPAEVLKAYQDRTEEPARKLLDAGKKSRDPAPLWLLLDRYFASRPADEGLLLLGDLLFERGDFRTADIVWRRLLPDADADIVYPSTKADPAAVRARLALTAIFLGEAERARTGLAAFREKHPGAKGTLAGKDGPYAETLQKLLDAPPNLAAAANPGTDWPTFGGSPERSLRVGTRIPAYWPAMPTWVEAVDKDRLGFQEHPPPLGHPIVVNGRVFVTDGTRLCGLDLLRGKPTLGFDLLTGKPTNTFPPQRAPNVGRGALGVCPALTGAGDRLYIRVGSGLLRPPTPNEANKLGEETAIVCLGPDEKTDDRTTLREFWRVKPPLTEPKTPTFWEGAPLVAGRRMWAAFVRFEGGRVVHGIACFDPADSTERPSAPAWTVDVCDSSLTSGTDGRARQELLTLAGRNVVFVTNTGGVIALDAVTGKRAWAFRYPRSKKGDSLRTPDAAPAIAVGGRVFAAPADADRVYALDAETGALLWESGPTEGAQLLGVSGDKLIVTVTGPLRGIRAMNVRNGSQRRPDGWVQHDNGGLLGYGRGFVTDEVIVWPTRSGLFFLRPEDGFPMRPPFYNSLGPIQPNHFGNVIYADGVLIVVTPTHVWGYVSDRKRFAGVNDRSSRDPVREKFETLIVAAETALVAGDRGAAWQSLHQATAPEFPRPLRAWAVARLLLLTPTPDPITCGLPPHVWLAWKRDLWGEWVLPPDGVPVTLLTLFQRHLGCEPNANPRFPPTPAVHERDPNDPPALGAEARVSRTLKLEPGSLPLPRLAGDQPPRRVFVATGAELLAVPLRGGKPARYECCGSFTGVVELAEGFLVVGPLTVALYGDGAVPLWVFRVPGTEPLPTSPGTFQAYSDEPVPSAELSSFRLRGSWLLARLGDRHLIAFDLHNRRVGWVLNVHGEHGFRPVTFPDAPRFGSEFSTTSRLIVVQLSDGRRWGVQLETGRILGASGLGDETARAWWSHPPAELEGNRIAVSDGPGIVRLLNLTTGRVRWTHEVEGDSSLTGEPPQVRAWGRVLLVAVRRNHGVELRRLDFTDGKPLWSGDAAFLDTDRVNLSCADIDNEHVFVAGGNTLTAVALKDGKVLWEAELPDTRAAGTWVVRVGHRCLIVYPTAGIPAEPVGGVFARVVRSFQQEPALWRLPGLLFGLYDAWVARTVPVLLFDPVSGERLARLDVPAAGPVVTAWFERGCCVVATGDRVVWLR